MWKDCLVNSSVTHQSKKRPEGLFCVSPAAFIQGRHQKGHWCWIILPLQAPESADQQFTVRYRSFLQSWLLWHKFQGLWFYKPILLAEASSLVHLGWVCGKLFAGEIVSQHKVSIHLDAAFALSWRNIGLSGLCWNSDSMSTFQSSTNPPIPTQKPTITMTPPHPLHFHALQIFGDQVKSTDSSNQGLYIMLGIGWFWVESLFCHAVWVMPLAMKISLGCLSGVAHMHMLHARRAAPELHLILLAQDMEVLHITNWRFQHVKATHLLFWTSLIPFCMGNLRKRIWMLLSRSCTQNEFLRRMVWWTAAWHSKGANSKFVDLKRTWIVMAKLGQNGAIIYRTHWNEQGVWEYLNFQTSRPGSRLGLQH